MKKWRCTICGQTFEGDKIESRRRLHMQYDECNDEKLYLHP